MERGLGGGCKYKWRERGSRRKEKVEVVDGWQEGEGRWTEEEAGGRRE